MMQILRDIRKKVINLFFDEKMPEFAAPMYINLARSAKTSFYQQTAAEIVAEINCHPSAKTILDIGTGPGFLLIEISKLRPDLFLLGLDLCQRLLDEAREESRKQGCIISFDKCDANSLKIQNNLFDFIVSSGVLHSLKKPAAAIKEWFRVLKPGGNLWIYDPTFLAGDESSSRAHYKETISEKLKDMKVKDRFLFRLMSAVSRWRIPHVMPIERVKKIIRNSGIENSAETYIKDNKTYVKIEIKKVRF